jgi:hypothetical protein
MALISDRVTPLAPTPAQGANRCRQVLRMAVQSCIQACNAVNQAIEKHTRAALVTELGDDAAELANVYTDVRNLAKKYMDDPGDLKS